MNDRTPPTDPTLVPLLRERQFYAAALIGLPALAVGYLLGIDLALEVLADEVAIDEAAGAIGALVALLTANPLTVYLAARQYPRGKAVEAVGVELASTPLVDPDLDTPADDALMAAGEAHLEEAREGDGGLA